MFLMGKKKPVKAKFDELQWFAQQAEIIRDLLWEHFTNNEGWKWKDDGHKWQEYGSLKLKYTFVWSFAYRQKSIPITVGQSELIIDISLLGQGYPASSVVVEINETLQSRTWQLGTFEHRCSGGNPMVNIRRVIEMAMYFIMREFTGSIVREFPDSGRERFYPPPPPEL